MFSCDTSQFLVLKREWVCQTSYPMNATNNFYSKFAQGTFMVCYVMLAVESSVQNILEKENKE
jgi:hypothetical protein